MTPIGLTASWWRDESGQDMIEWALLIAFVAVAAAALLETNTEAIASIWSSAQTQLKKAQTGPGL